MSGARYSSQDYCELGPDVDSKCRQVGLLPRKLGGMTASPAIPKASISKVVDKQMTGFAPLARVKGMDVR